MASCSRKARVAFYAALAMTATGGVSAQDTSNSMPAQSEAAMVLHVTNYADLSRQVLDEARSRVQNVYRAIGVRVEWVESGKPFGESEDGRRQLSVMLLSRDMAQKKISAERLEDHVLGQAHLPSWRSYIFCHRIAKMNGAPVSLSVPLGNVIAHEVGHLLLRSSRHSHDGIMRANADKQPILQRFNDSEARTIRATLVKPTASLIGR